MSTSKPKEGTKAVQIIMDSNALFAPFQFKIDVFGELERVLNRHFELILLSAVRNELEMLVDEGSPKMRKMAAFALKSAEKCRNVDIGSTKKTVDDVIVETAARCRTPVFTNDVQLRKRLRDISVPVIYLRQKSRLEIDGLI